MTAAAIDRLLTRPCVLLTRRAMLGPVDELDGDPLAGDSEFVELGATTCELQQTTAGEVVDGRVMVTGWRVILPASALELGDVTGWGALQLGDVLDADRPLEFDGEPWLVRHPVTGDVHHVEGSLRRSI